jgi:hypothetical protein
MVAPRPRLRRRAPVTRARSQIELNTLMGRLP